MGCWLGSMFGEPGFLEPGIRIVGMQSVEVKV